mmetsp:Transcript_16056/g.37939  ORF Transcript_16056/g.37939 Transcript_16056/m.37939 type:complete len:239 (+) Transcript_16056:21-737(+)
MPKRQPRCPSIGLYSLSSSARRFTRSRGNPAALATAASSESVCGRNSCRGGSSKRMVTGSPLMMSKSSTMSSRCMKSSLCRASLRSRSSEAKIICRMATMRRPPKNMCSVRTRPKPSAPNSLAWRVSAMVSALARTCMLRNSSVHFMSVWNCFPSTEDVGGRVATSPSITSPVAPSMLSLSPSFTTTSPTRNVLEAKSTAPAPEFRPAPTMHGRPIPRATTAAWLVMPPVIVSTPAAA